MQKGDGPLHTKAITGWYSTRDSSSVVSAIRLAIRPFRETESLPRAYEGGRRTNTLISLPAHLRHPHPPRLSLRVPHKRKLSPTYSRIVLVPGSLLRICIYLRVRIRKILTCVCACVRTCARGDNTPFSCTHTDTQGGRATTSISEYTHTYIGRRIHMCTCANARPPAYK